MSTWRASSSIVKDRLVDPKLALPLETFYQVVSSLSPQSIARSSAISKEWRETINANPALHREIDLSNLGFRDYPECDFKRLASLCDNDVRKLSLNLSSTWEEYVRAKIVGDSNWEDEEGDDLLYLIRSQTNLKEVFFLLMDKRTAEDTSDFLILFLDPIFSSKHRGKFKIVTPITFILKRGGGEELGSKSFDFINNRLPIVIATALTDVLGVMKKARGFWAQGFLLSGPNNWQEPNQYIINLAPRVLEELLHSNLTLKTGYRLWNFSMKFPNLDSLSSVLFNLHDVDQAASETLEIPNETVLVEGLKKLNLKVYGYRIPWKSISSWIGGQLQELELVGTALNPEELLQHHISTSPRTINLQL